MSDVVGLAAALIARPSLTPDDAGCQDLVAAQLKSAGFVCETLRFGEVANLWARHGDTDPIVCLLGHTDVVPPGPRAAWSSDPFVPTQHDGRLVGRGACDMKGAVAAMTVAAARFVRDYPEHTGSVALLLTSDEEGDARDGIAKAAPALAARGERIAMCLVGEPSSVERLGDVVKIGRRGSLTGRLMVPGVQGHVAYPERARNPIHRALAAMAELTALVWDEGSDSFPPTSFQWVDVAAGTGASNVIPGELTATFNLRYSPASTPESIAARVRAVLAQHGLDDAHLDWQHSAEPFLTMGGPLLEAVRAAVVAEVSSEPAPSTSGGTSDGRFLAALGAQVVELGPVGTSMHQADEWVAIDDLEALTRIYYDVLVRLLAA